MHRTRAPTAHRHVVRETEASTRALAGVGNQGRCPNGNVDCRLGSGDTGAPCFECVFGGDE
ncbi:hypothetical protein NDI85_21395 [Halomicroarcula sp. S1AR25-4]|uniref:hypothetical protein n=1 Tax=Haloarcula sp. S1AR25-4 TaxID=2950538 RepID=UPI002876CF1F|nr:hypothetical protein [Halomicroarcula sp. S1AR25-4]MDS0280344.1 hypothetical protein [Halomicroarcula sp. S1AR25-4]